MKIGITGAEGLLGFHVRAWLYSQQGRHEVRLANRSTFQSESALNAFVDGLDGVIHCAGVNRGDDTAVESTNRWLAEALVKAFQRMNTRPSLVYANSTHIERDTAYGRGKRAAGECFFAWGQDVGARVINLVLPHIFGEFGKPFYNSVVSTFCYQLANSELPRIDIDGQLELVHAQDVARFSLNVIENSGSLDLTVPVRISGRLLKVTELLVKLRGLHERYLTQVIPNLSDTFDLRLFNTLRSYLYPKYYPCYLHVHSDPRGQLFEAVKSDQGGQTFLSSTHPCITRGNHYHTRKVERFLVVSGEAEICLRKLFSDEIQTFRVSGDRPSYVDMPTFHTHSITNVGTDEVQTLFWSSEIFDPSDADTYAETVKQ